MQLMLIAEIGSNHKGELETAHQMIKFASIFCQVNVVKFQKRTPKELLTKEEYNARQLNSQHSFGETYGQHLEFLEFDVDEHRLLKQWCEEENLIYSTSVWDMTAAREIVSIDPKMIKIPSASNLDFEMLGFLCNEFQGEIHLSLGMTTRKEEEKIVSFFEKRGRNKDLVLYACTSGLRIPFDDLSLLEIARLKDTYSGRIKAFGFSGHHLGIAADIAAMTLGATYFQRHLTLDHTWKGADQAASLEPEEMRRLAHDLRDVSRALTHKKEEILNIEKEERLKLKKRISVE